MGGLGLGLDLSKAKEIQQQKLAMAEEKKSHARQTAEIARAAKPVMGLNLGAVQQNSSSKPQISGPRQGVSGTPDNFAENSGRDSSDNAEFATPSSQGQGESYRDSAASGRGAVDKTSTGNNQGAAAPISMPSLASLNQKVAALGNQATTPYESKAAGIENM